MSEFSYYSFCSGYDPEEGRAGRLTFQEWLGKRYQRLEIVLHEHPTYDTKPVDADILAEVREDIFGLLSTGRTVVVVDSGGMERTGQVVNYLSAAEITSCH